jgi:hypothetical protein
VSQMEPYDGGLRRQLWRGGRTKCAQLMRISLGSGNGVS